MISILKQSWVELNPDRINSRWQIHRGQPLVS